MKIIWTDTAIKRLQSICDYISKDKPEAARKWAENLFLKVETICDYPLSFRVVPEIRKKVIREIIFGDYRIIFKLENESIFILTICNSRQRLPKLGFYR